MAEENELKEIGLSDSETKVYKALLKIGPSTTGAIIKESKTANSKVYEILDKLAEKGLVSQFIKSGVKNFKAASPKRILDYLEKRKEEITKQEKTITNTITKLIEIQEQKNKKPEALIFSGARGIKTAFAELVEETKPSEEIHVMGVHEFSEEFAPLALYFQNLRSHKKIKAKFLINETAKDIAKKFSEYKPVEIRFLKKEDLTPAIFIIKPGKVIINMPNEMTFFVLESESASESFETYFQILWRNSKTIKNPHNFKDK